MPRSPDPGGTEDDRSPGFWPAAAAGIRPAVPARPVAASAVRPETAAAARRAARGALAAGTAPAAGPAVATAGIPATAPGTCRMAAARMGSAAPAVRSARGGRPAMGAARCSPAATAAEAEALARPAQGALRTHRGRRDRHHRRRRVLVEPAVNAGRGQHHGGEQPRIPGGGTVIRRGQLGSEHARCSRQPVDDGRAAAGR